ncbi:DUF6889 family protein [Pandoraea communis]
MKDGAIDLADVALLNDALAVQADNRAMARRIQEQQHE